MAKEKKKTLEELGLKNEQVQAHLQNIKDVIGKCHTSLRKAHTADVKDKVKRDFKEEIASITEGLLKDAQCGARSAFEEFNSKRVELVGKLVEKPDEDASKNIDKLYSRLDLTSKGFKKLDKEVDKVFGSIAKGVEENGQVVDRQLLAFALGMATVLLGVVALYIATIASGTNNMIVGGNLSVRGNVIGWGNVVVSDNSSVIHTSGSALANYILGGQGIALIGAGVTGAVVGSAMIAGAAENSEADNLTKFAKFYEANIATLVNSMQKFEKSLPQEVQGEYKEKSADFRKLVEQQPAVDVVHTK